MRLDLNCEEFKRLVETLDFICRELKLIISEQRSDVLAAELCISQLIFSSQNGKVSAKDGLGLRIILLRKI